MKHPLTLALTLALTTSLGACTQTDASPQADDSQSESAVNTKTSNPFFTESQLPLHYPRFDQIDDSHFGPAFDRGMAEHLEEIEAIAANPEPATFDNTIIPLEKSGDVLSRTASVFFALVGADTNDTRKEIQAAYAPKLSAHSDAISLNPELFARVETLYENRDSLGPDPEAVRLIERYHTDFVRAGAQLSEADKTRLKEINTELATLSTEFSQNVLAEVNASAVVVDTLAELDGLSEQAVAAAAQAAEERDLEGKYVITLQNTTGQPPNTYLTDRDLRQRIHEASVARGSRGNEYDNTGVASQIFTLRAERADMMGYENHAEYVLEDETAQTPEAVSAMLNQLAPAAVANARREGEMLQAMIDSEQAAKGEPSFELEPWDWAFYAEKVRQDQYDFDESQLKPYFEIENVLENGVFYAANQLYGLTFKQRTDLPVYHPDVTVYDVFDKDGEQLAIFLFDPYARASKRGGAWMNYYVDQSALTGNLPVVATHQNTTEPPEGEPTLLSWEEVTTMFHEFGHALHGMFSDVEYPYFSGTSVPRDFVEFPSQVNEMWADWPSVLANYANHHETGEPMPQELLDKVLASAQFNQGHATTEYLAAAMLNQQWHRPAADEVPEADGIMAFEAAALEEIGLDYDPVPPRYKTPYFSHIMGGYAAAYYAYIWSEVLDANTVAWIKENGGLTRENGDRFRATLLSQGGSKDALQLFRDFTGMEEPKIEPLLERRGLGSPVTDDVVEPAAPSPAEAPTPG